jgi:hypothetical protein
MAYTENMKCVSLIAGANLATEQYSFLKVDTAGAVVLAGAGEDVDGVLMNDPASGRVAQVAVDGIVKVKCGGTIAAGASVASNASGKAVAATTGQMVAGKALEAGVTGRIISVLLQPKPAVA